MNDDDDDDTPDDLRFLIERIEAVATRRGIGPETEVSAAEMISILAEARNDLANEIDANRKRHGLPPVVRRWESA